MIHRSRRTLGSPPRHEYPTDRLLPALVGRVALGLFGLGTLAGVIVVGVLWIYYRLTR